MRRAYGIASNPAAIVAQEECRCSAPNRACSAIPCGRSGTMQRLAYGHERLLISLPSLLCPGAASFVTLDRI